MTEGPRQPRRRAGNIRAAYLCPVCRESQAKLESHLTECFSRFLDEVKEQTLSPPLPDLSEHFHPVFPVFLPPPPIPAAVAPEVDSERITRLSSLDLLLDHHVSSASPLDTSGGSLSAREYCGPGTCPFCAEETDSLKDHLASCISPDESAGPLPVPGGMKVKPISHRWEPSSSAPPPFPEQWKAPELQPLNPKPTIPKVPSLSPRTTPTNVSPTNHARAARSQSHTHRNTSPRSAREQPKSPRSPRDKFKSKPAPSDRADQREISLPNLMIISPRREKRDRENRVKKRISSELRRSSTSETHVLGAATEKRSRTSKKKEKATPFNLPGLEELPGIPKAQDDNQDSKVLKISINTTAPGSAQVVAKFPEINPQTPAFSQYPEDCLVVIVCLENLMLCRMKDDGNIVADGKDAMQKDCQYWARRREGSSDLRFKHEVTGKYFLGREPISEMSNYLIRNRKKQYHCVYFSKSTKEVTMGVGQERSMFRVYMLAAEYQRCPRPTVGSYIGSS